MSNITIKLVETENDMEAAVGIRFRVFVDEQAVPPEIELDEYDAVATHAIALLDGVAVGTGRTIVEGNSARIGRMAVDLAHRRSGVGGLLLRFLEDQAREQGAEEFVLHAQEYVKAFLREARVRGARRDFHGGGHSPRRDAQGGVMQRTFRVVPVQPETAFPYQKSVLHHNDCFSWIEQQPQTSVHGVVTDPPYGLYEYSEEQQTKLRAGKGGVWRIPPSFDGNERSPLPRFTTLDKRQLADIGEFFSAWAYTLLPVLTPGANVIVASNPLVSHIVSMALDQAGLERTGRNHTFDNDPAGR